MKLLTTPLEGLFIIEPRVISDSRGYFFESYNAEKYLETGISAVFVQDNESRSAKNVIRGLHYQLEPYAQAKLVRVVVGEVYDVALDLRQGSATYGSWFGVKLSAENKRQLYIPRGFAHGFSVLSETAVFSYKCDGFYNANAERGIRYDDPVLDIDWQIEPGQAIVSEKDLRNPVFQQAEKNFRV